MKYKILDIYNARLDERLKRKKFVIERGLLDFNKQNNLDKSRTKEEKEIYNLMKVFARFNTSDDHEKLVQGIIKEKQIRQRIEELKFYRKLGIKTFEEVEVRFILFHNKHSHRLFCWRREKKMRHTKRNKNRLITTFMRIK